MSSQVNGDVDEHDEQAQEDELNFDTAGRVERVVPHSATLQFVTVLELIALLSKRLAQINDFSNPHSQIDPDVVARLGEGAGLYQLLLAEVADETIDYPVEIMRGHGPNAKSCRLHKDLRLEPAILDYFVLADETGRVSYNSVEYDLANNAHAPTLALARDIEQIDALTDALGGKRI